MAMTLRIRKGALTAHIACSVGWFGAVFSFLALALAGLLSQDLQVVRAAYLSMSMIGWWVIVPLSFASIATGLVQVFSTSWGLVRHYWVMLKFMISIVATSLLLLHLQPVNRIASVAAAGPLSNTDLRELRIAVAADAASALLALIAALSLAVYKPKGMTSYGWRRQQPRAAQVDPRAAEGTPRWVYVFAGFVLAALIAVRLLTGSGHAGHAH
jgi:hypothetical protein